MTVQTIQTTTNKEQSTTGNNSLSNYEKMFCDVLYEKLKDVVADPVRIREKVDAYKAE